MRKKKMTMKERKQLVGLCWFCNRPENEHRPVTTPEGIQLMCVDAYVNEDGKLKEYRKWERPTKSAKA